jgi:hypothetical protein
LPGQELEDEPAGRGGLEGRSGDEVGEAVAHAANLALDDPLDGGAEEAQAGRLGAFLEAPFEDVRGDLADGQLVGGRDVAEGAQGVAGDPGGDLGLLGHGSSFFGSARESPGASERERSERERLSCYTEPGERQDVRRSGFRRASVWEEFSPVRKEFAAWPPETLRR